MSNVDGTTVATINPVLTETEMSLITRLANFVVQSSDLHNKFPALEAEIASMRRQLDHEQTVARDFSEQLIKVGQERDEAKAEAKAAIDGRIRVETDYQQLKTERDMLHAEGSQTYEALNVARKERDDYGMQVLTLTDEVDKLKAKLAKFHAILADDEPKAPEAPQLVPLDLQKDSDDYASAKAVEITDHNPPSAEHVAVTAPQEDGYVPFAESTPEPVPTVDASVSVTAEPAKDRVYVEYNGSNEDEFAKANRWDDEKAMWYYVKPSA